MEYKLKSPFLLILIIGFSFATLNAQNPVKGYAHDLLKETGNSVVKLQQVSNLGHDEAFRVVNKNEIMDIGKPGGFYIFSTSDFLEKGTPIENVKAMIKAAKEAGQYK